MRLFGDRDWAALAIFVFVMGPLLEGRRKFVASSCGEESEKVG